MRTEDLPRANNLSCAQPPIKCAIFEKYTHVPTERYRYICGNAKDTESTFSELLQKDCAVTIHTKNLQILMTEMYKTKNKLDPSFMQGVFREKTTGYNLRNNEFTQP